MGSLDIYRLGCAWHQYLGATYLAGINMSLNMCRYRVRGMDTHHVVTGFPSYLECEVCKGGLSNMTGNWLQKGPRQPVTSPAEPPPIVLCLLSSIPHHLRKGCGTPHMPSQNQRGPRSLTKLKDGNTPHMHSRTVEFCYQKEKLNASIFLTRST